MTTVWTIPATQVMHLLVHGTGVTDVTTVRMAGRDRDRSTSSRSMVLLARSSDGVGGRRCPGLEVPELTLVTGTKDGDKSPAVPLTKEAVEEKISG